MEVAGDWAGEFGEFSVGGEEVLAVALDHETAVFDLHGLDVARAGDHPKASDEEEVFHRKRRFPKTVFPVFFEGSEFFLRVQRGKLAVGADP